MVFSRTHIKDPTRLNELLGEHGQPGSRKSNKYVDVDQDMSADCMDWDDAMLKGKKSQ